MSKHFWEVDVSFQNFWIEMLLLLVMQIIYNSMWGNAERQSNISATKIFLSPLVVPFQRWAIWCTATFVGNVSQRERFKRKKIQIFTSYHTQYILVFIKIGKWVYSVIIIIKIAIVKARETATLDGRWGGNTEISALKRQAWRKSVVFCWLENWWLF